MTKIALSALLLAQVVRGAAPDTRLMFSPNGDSLKDDVTFKLSLQENANVSRWLFEIKSEGGAPVKTFSGSGRPPRELKWDGKALDNRIVQDGTYLYSLSLVTDAGNQTAIAPSPVIVTRVPPQASLTVAPPIFSPGGSGPKNEAEFGLSASGTFGIHSWLLTVKDKDAAPARQFAGRGSPSAVIKWDGRGDFQEDLPDGKYSVELTVEDPAGNRTTTPQRTITIKRAAAVSVIQVFPDLFSPNGDGYKDDVVFKIASADPEQVDHWTLRVLNQSGKIVKEFSGVREPPSRVIWDGRANDNKPASDGTYQVVLAEVDLAGNTATTIPQLVVLDTTPPFVEARLEPALLSPLPNGKGYHKEGVFHLKAVDRNPLDRWSLKILNDVGAVVKTVAGSQGSAPPINLPWKGEGDDGGTVIDGAYGYVLEAVDLGGSKAATPKQTLRVDTTPPLIAITLNEPLFSPNGDAAHNQALFDLSIRDAGPLESWRLLIRDAKQAVVRTFTGTPEMIPPKLAWDGKNQDHAPLPDGDYTYVVEAKDVAGNAVASPPQKVTIGATKPTPEVEADLRAISPNADGFKDDTSFRMKAPAFNRIIEWALRILDKPASPGKPAAVRRAYHGRGDVHGTELWKGEGDDRRTLPDGEYFYSLSVVDAAGNRSESLPKPIRVDTTPPELGMKVQPNPFSPNGDGFKDEALFTLSYKDASPIGDWKLSCHNTKQKVVRTFSGKGDLPLSVAWKGDGDDGVPLPDGPYTCVFAASDDVGNKADTPDQIVRVVNTPPQVSVQADPPLFSPVAERGKNETTLLLDAKSDADMSTWRLSIAGKDATASRTFSGLGQPPRSLPWDGKNDHGRQAPDGVYQALLSVTDEVGNNGKSQLAKITIDTSKPIVTVTAETEQLTDLVPQMTVVQNQARDLVISLSNEVLFDTGQAVLKTKAYDTLMKAVSLIRRYPQRQVRIEGHADNVPIHNEQFANNGDLSQGRARAVLAFFKDKGGVDGGRLTALGFGDTRPKTTNETEEGRRINRRVEIILLKETK